MFKKEINPFAVSDKVTFRNVDKTLTLTVRTGVSPIVIGLKQAQEKLKALTDESDECEKVNAARFFAKVIFGETQADQLVDFYEEPMAVIAATGLYFDQRLKKIITKAQKK